MANIFDRIKPEQRALIEESNLFFVASVAPDLGDSPVGAGPLNLSPKGGVPLHVIDETCVAYLDYQGSGNETARHAEAEGPITLMIMSSSDQDAGIVRLYGRARGHALGRVATRGAPAAIDGRRYSPATTASRRGGDRSDTDELRLRRANPGIRA